MREAIKKYRPETNMADLDNFDSAKAIAESIGIKVEKLGSGPYRDRIFEEVAEAHLIQPTFITEYPAEVSRWRVVMTRIRRSLTVLNSSSVAVKSATASAAERCRRSGAALRGSG